MAAQARARWVLGLNTLNVNKKEYNAPIIHPQETQVKQSEFKRWLAAQGAIFKEGANHTRVFLNGRQSTLPRHPGHEMGQGLMHSILKQLGLK